MHMERIRFEEAMLVYAAIWAVPLLASWLATCAWQDLLESGATLAEILRAGQWKSAAFMRYLNLADIEKVHASAHLENALSWAPFFVGCSAGSSLRHRR